jgi:uncharacterized membrane protein YkoI
MNLIKFYCPNCSQHLESGEEARGTFIDCPTCKIGFMVPDAASCPAPQAPGEARIGVFRKATPGRTVLALCVILVAGLVVTFSFLARAGRPASQGRAQPAASEKRHASIDSSASSPKSMPADMLCWLPAKAHQTILAQAADGEINSVNESIQDGVVVLEVEFTKDKLSRSFSVDTDGNLLSFEVFEAELPPAVKVVIGKEFPGASFSQIEMQPDEDGKCLYAMEVECEGREHSLTVSEKGDWWSLEIEAERVPDQVKRAIGRLWDGFKMSSIRKIAQQGDICYEFDAEQEALQHRLTVAPDGHVIGRQDQTTLEQVPTAVRSRVMNQIGAGELIQISQATCEDVVSYEVTALKDGQEIAFSVNRGGQVLGPGN